MGDEFGPEQDYPPMSPPSSKPILARELDGGPMTFLDLLDTINSYAGHGGKFLMVSLTESGVTVSAIEVESDKHFSFSQPTPSLNWGTINHALGKKPAVQILNSAGNKAHAKVTYVDDDNVTITSDVAFSGVAYFN